MLKCALLVLSFGILTQAQEKQSSENAEVCSGPVYSAKELDQKARVTFHPEPSYTEEARQNKVRGTVSFSGVYCLTGKITDIQVLEKQPFGLTEEALKALKQIRFEAGLKDGKPASQRFKAYYSFDM
jgi:TonB family protein